MSTGDMPSFLYSIFSKKSCEKSIIYKLDSSFFAKRRYKKFFEKTDAAMYESKHKGKNTYTFYT